MSWTTMSCATSSTPCALLSGEIPQHAAQPQTDVRPGLTTRGPVVEEAVAHRSGRLVRELLLDADPRQFVQNSHLPIPETLIGGYRLARERGRVPADLAGSGDGPLERRGEHRIRLQGFVSQPAAERLSLLNTQRGEPTSASRTGRGARLLPSRSAASRITLPWLCPWRTSHSTGGPASSGRQSSLAIRDEHSRVGRGTRPVPASRRSRRRGSR